MALVNQGVFLATRTVLPTLAASAAAIAVAAVGNYLLGDRLVFRGRGAAARDGRADGLHTREDHAA